MLNKYEWDKIFRERVIALCFSPNWFAKYSGTIIHPEYFELGEEQRLVRFINDYYQSYGHPPDEDELMAEFINDEDIRELIQSVLDKTDMDLSYTQYRAVQFAKEQAIKLAFLDSMSDLENGLFSRIESRMKQALEVGSEISDIGIDLVQDSDRWMNTLFLADDKISTGIPLVDIMLDGGVSRKTYNLILGPSNIGKTLMLVNLGFGAATEYSRANVFHLSLEMKEELVATRYAARVVDNFLTSESDMVAYKEDLIYMAKLRLFAKIRIKDFPSGACTIQMINQQLDMLDMIDFHPDVLIVDYPKIMKHERVGEYRHNISNSTVQLRGIASDRNIVVWGAAQANRSSYSSSLVGADKVAEDIGQIENSDLVVSISQTKAEYKEDLLRLFGAKVRSNRKFWQVLCKVYGDSHAVIGLEYVEDEPEDIPEEEDASKLIKEYIAERKSKKNETRND